MGLVTVLETGSPGELAFVKSLLDGNGIAYVVCNEHFGSLYSGVASLACAVLVQDWELERAAILLSKLRDSPASDLDAE
jgi:hypothetical protein